MSHWYTEDGKLTAPGSGYPSPTTILAVRDKPRLNDWRARVGQEEALRVQKEGMERGSAVHSTIEQLLASVNFPTELHAMVPTELRPYVNGFVNWYAEVKPAVLAAEQFLISKRHHFAGTADLICLIDDQPFIVDYKTSKIMDPGMGLQLKAYQQALKEMTGRTAKMAVLQLTDQTKKGYRWKMYSEPLGIFLAHKKIFDWQLKHVIVDSPIKWDGGLIHAK